MIRYFCDFCNKEVPAYRPNDTSITVKFDVYFRTYQCCDSCFEELTNLLHNDTVEEFDIQTNTKTKKKSKAFFKTVKEKLWKKKDESKTTSSPQ